MRRFTIIFIDIGLILCGILILMIGIKQFRVSKRPVVPIEQAVEGDHVNVTMTKLVSHFDTEIHYGRRSKVTHSRNKTYYHYMLVELEEGGYMVICKSSGTPEFKSPEFPKHYDGVLQKVPDEMLEKARQAMPDQEATLYECNVSSIKQRTGSVIIGSVLILMGVALTVFLIRNRK